MVVRGPSYLRIHSALGLVLVFINGGCLDLIDILVCFIVMGGLVLFNADNMFVWFRLSALKCLVTTTTTTTRCR